MTENEIFDRLHADAESIKNIAASVEKINGKFELLASQITGMEKRLEMSEEMTKGIYKLAANIEVHAQKIDHLADKMETRMANLEERQLKQGERLGVLELTPGDEAKDKMKHLSRTILAAIITSVVGLVIGLLIGLLTKAL